MRSAILIVALFLSMNLTYANDEPVVEVDVDEMPVQIDETYQQGDDIAIYCDEQAQLADIVGANEKSEYMRDCVASFTTHLD